MSTGFLPISKEELKEPLDFVLVTGDAYVDHPSFGSAIISRVLEAQGFKVGIIPQPNWKNPQSYLALGRPRLAFLVNSGNVDSMVAHYTAAKKPRSEDAYSPGGKAGRRPDRAVTVYSRGIKALCPDIPVIIGGLEASLRRFAHYDYWDDTVRPSILVESGADLLIFGMGEHPIREIAEALASGAHINSIRSVRGTCYLSETKDTPFGGAECPSLKQVRGDKVSYAKASRIQQDWQDEVYGKVILQRHERDEKGIDKQEPGDWMLVQNPPAMSLTTEELDVVYSLPYQRRPHPSYDSAGGVPGIAEVEFSITHNRGCFGGCNFCSIAFHQGRRITCRSKESILKEAALLTTLPGFKGYIHDIGGPTANFRRPSCDKQLSAGLCKGKKCLAPTPCPSLKAEHGEYLDILRAIRELPKIKKVFIRSGIRYDYLLADSDESFFKELVKHHVSGQLKVAPEHCSAAVLDKMGKPYIKAYLDFSKRYFALSGNAGKEQYLVPYLMSSHPGSTLREAVELAVFLKEHRIRPEQVQDFYPTPGTISTSIFYTGLDPYTLEPVYVPKTPEEKAMQRALLQYYLPKNQDLVREALKRAGRRDLIGNGPKCLVTEISRGGNFSKSKSSAPSKPEAQRRGEQWKSSGSKNFGKPAKPGKKS